MNKAVEPFPQGSRGCPRIELLRSAIESSGWTGPARLGAVVNPKGLRSVRRGGLTFLILLAAVTMTAVVACSKPPAAPNVGAAAPVPVSAAAASNADVPIVIRAIGSVEPKARVMLRPQVAGRIIELPVEEGTNVTQGQVLVRLDPRPYEAALAQAQANVARSIALADDAHRLAERTSNAAYSAAISQHESESARAQAAAADAQTLASKAEVQTAELNLAYCTIAAPFSGRLGSFLVKPGSIVKENEADLVELAQIDPIEVSFAVPEENIPAIHDAMDKGQLKAEALPSGDPAPPAVGLLTFVDNRVDAATGTIRLKATYANSSRRLWPGQFANVSLLLGLEKGRVVVPESAVQTTQSGAAVFVIKPDQTAELRQVTVGRTVEGRSVIEQGLVEGDMVVTEGQLRLKNGSTVQVKPPQTAAAGGQKSPS